MMMMGSSPGQVVSLKPSEGPQVSAILSSLSPLHQQAVRDVTRIKRDLYLVKHLVLLPKSELHQLTMLSPSDLASLLEQLSFSLIAQPNPITALQLWTGQDVDSVPLPRLLSWGCPVLDDMFRGGLRTSGIAEISGESSSGKTQLCLQLLLQALLPANMGGLDGVAVYFSTEGDAPLKRLNQMAEYYKHHKFISNSHLANFDFLSNIFMEKISNLDGLWEILSSRIAQLISSHHRQLRLIVIDSLAALFRFEFSRDEAVERSRVLWNYANQLKYISSKYGVAVVVINQVTDYMPSELDELSPQDKTSRDGNVLPYQNYKQQFTAFAIASSTPGRAVIPSLGLAWSNCINTRILIRRTSRTLSPRGNKKRKLAASLDQTGDSYSEQSSPDIIVREMRIALSPCLEERSCYFIVDSEGVKGIQLGGASP